MKISFKLFVIAAVTSATFAACSGGNKGSESDTSSSTMADSSMNGGGMSGDTSNMGGMSDTTSTTDTGSRM